MKASDNQISILHLIQTLQLGGAEMTLLQYVKALGTTDYIHYVYCFGSDGPMREKLADVGAKVTMGKKRGTVKRPVSFLFSLKNLVNDLIFFITKYKINIIHSHLPNANQLAVVVSKRTKTPVFLTIHSTMEFEDPRSRLDPRVHFMRIVTTFAYHRADKIIAISDEVKEIACKKIKMSPEKVEVIKNGILLSENIVPANVGDFFSAPPVKGGMIIAVGRLVPLKGFDTLIRAMGKVPREMGLQLMIVGEGEERPYLEKLIKELNLGDNVKLLGLRHDVMALMKSSDFFVIPSRYEGLSVAMIEAMASRLAIIASDAPGLKGYITNAKNGFLFPSGDQNKLAEQIIMVAKGGNERQKIAMEAYGSYMNNYNLSNNIKPLMTLYHNFSTSDNF